jgi:hypothetical protein
MGKKIGLETVAIPVITGLYKKNSSVYPDEADGFDYGALFAGFF